MHEGRCTCGDGLQLCCAWLGTVLQVYICGVADEGVPVPTTAADVHPRPEAIAQLRSVAASVSEASRPGGGGGRYGLLWSPYGASLLSLVAQFLAPSRRHLCTCPHALQELGSAELLREQACYLPCTTDNLPVIGRVPGLENAYVATGHSCWGILNAPATGEALAELLVYGRARSVDLGPFDPARFHRAP